jgi:hypothetical protein
MRLIQSKTVAALAVLTLFIVSPSFAQQATTTPVDPAAKTAPVVPPAPVTQPAPAAVTPAPAAPVAADPVAPGGVTDPSAADTEGGDDGGLSIGEIPAVETEELTADMARKALDAYVLVHDKYKDSPLENYDDLQAFVDKDPKGKDFETDVKGFGFKDVNDWNLAITTLSFAYTNVLDDQTADIKQQIEEVTADTEMAQDMKDRMIKSLKAMIPSDNNHKIVDDLMKDTAYSDKIKLLETTEE